MTKYIKDKFRNVTAISFKAYDNDLIINFSGFEKFGEGMTVSVVRGIKESVDRDR